MKFIENTKRGIGHRILIKKLGTKKRIPLVCNLAEAKSIGILYNATNPVSFEIIKSFTKMLTDKKSEVHVLGYVHSKKLIDHYLYRKGFDFFTKNNLNWYYRPIGDTIDTFIKRPFDILINLSLDESFPLQYIVALSKSKFKVGKYFTEPNYMDLMIDVEKEKATMFELKKEITKDKKVNGQKRELENEIEKKVEIELQLNFLINQITHYLTLIKRN